MNSAWDCCLAESNRCVLCRHKQAWTTSGFVVCAAVSHKSTCHCHVKENSRKLESLMRSLWSKCEHPDWEMKDSALELLGSLVRAVCGMLLRPHPTCYSWPTLHRRQLSQCLFLCATYLTRAHWCECENRLPHIAAWNCARARKRVSAYQSRRHGGVLVGLSPQAKLQAPPNWNKKHYKFVKFLSNLNVKTCPNAMPPYWRFSGDGSEHIRCYPTLNVRIDAHSSLAVASVHCWCFD